MKVFAIIAMMFTWSAHADEIFKNADIAAGKKLVDSHCIQCHASSYGGDGSGIYTREFRKVESPNGLVIQVRNCNTMLNLKWFEEDETNVAAYLNQQYYHFE